MHSPQAAVTPRPMPVLSHGALIGASNGSTASPSRTRRAAAIFPIRGGWTRVAMRLDERTGFRTESNRNHSTSFRHCQGAGCGEGRACRQRPRQNHPFTRWSNGGRRLTPSKKSARRTR